MGFVMDRDVAYWRTRARGKRPCRMVEPFPCWAARELPPAVYAWLMVMRVIAWRS